jgi:hypothetical protein
MKILSTFFWLYFVEREERMDAKQQDEAEDLADGGAELFGSPEGFYKPPVADSLIEFNRTDGQRLFELFSVVWLTFELNLKLELDFWSNSIEFGRISCFVGSSSL